MGLGPWFRLGRSELCCIRGVTVCAGIAGTDIGLTNNIKAREATVQSHTDIDGVAWARLCQ